MTQRRGVVHGRLQRQPGLNGFSINSFRSVLARHGLAIGLLLLLAVGLFLILESSGEEPGFLRPMAVLADGLQVARHHLLILIGLIGFALLYWRWRRMVVSGRVLAWMGYLGLISFAEELVFRFIAPQLLETALGWTWAVMVSNLVFAGLHYFTLRWQWVNCIAVFLGGLGLSRLFEVSDDFALIVLVHWFFTFLNTPLPPLARKP